MLSPIVVVGAGLAGLNCAKRLNEEGYPVLLIEASDDVGGRVRTDWVDGFGLDRGFQVFQSAYPEAQAALDYSKLDLVELEPGALVRCRGRWHRMSDPIRRPRHALATLWNSLGNLGDRFKLLRLRRDVRAASVGQLLENSIDRSTRDLLIENYGFSHGFIDCFLKPWIAGMTFDPDLVTSANYFQFVFKMLSEGPITYPRLGMQAIANQLRGPLSERQLRLNCPVARIDASRSETGSPGSHGVESIESGSTPVVRLQSGECIQASAVVLATQASAAAQLIGDRWSAKQRNEVFPARPMKSTTCIYFTADRVPGEKCLMLNGDSEGPVNHVFIPSNTVSGLAPEGKALISVSLVGPGALEYDQAAVVDQLKAWFGQLVDSWSVLRCYQIADALPEQLPGFYRSQTELGATAMPGDTGGIFLCGDYTETASIHGALRSGRVAAERVKQFVGSRSLS